MASCILHDEQLPQSPTAEMTAAHDARAATTSAGAGRVKSGFLSRRTWATPYCERSIASMWSSSSRTRILPLSKSPIVHPASDVSRAGPACQRCRVFTGRIEHAETSCQPPFEVAGISIAWVTACALEPNQGGITAPNPPAGPPAATTNKSSGDCRAVNSWSGPPRPCTIVGLADRGPVASEDPGRAVDVFPDVRLLPACGHEDLA